MKPILTAATLVAGIGAATTSASAQHEIASETARRVINGLILGGKVGPDFYTRSGQHRIKGDGRRRLKSRPAEDPDMLGC